MEGVRNVLKVSEPNNSVKERARQESLRGIYIYIYFLKRVNFITDNEILKVWSVERWGEGMGNQRYSNGVYQ